MGIKGKGEERKGEFWVEEEEGGEGRGEGYCVR